MEMHSVLTLKGISSTPVTRVILEMGSTVQVRFTLCYHCLSSVSVRFLLMVPSTDINECELGTHTCDSNANCTDAEDSFNCGCIDGYEGDGFNCTGK